MDIRKINIEDAENYLNMLLNLDTETKFMMFEPGERPADINIVKNIIDKSVNGDNLVLVAIDNENIIGFLSVQRGAFRRIRHSGYVIIGIRENYRGQGIGSMLFSELDLWAIENNVTRLELSVICSNSIAKHLYKKNGFEVEGLKRNTMIIDGEYVDEYSMAKLYNF